jgi:very-short-patch-repair endonuclease
MRRLMTGAEFRLWNRLRMGGLDGLRFRRQALLGRFIVDFLCAERRLIVEIDGDQHGRDANRRRDQGRTRWLESQGFRVVRFSNRDVMQNVEGVCTAIVLAANTDA